MPVRGDVLRAWRRSRGWDKAEMARRLRRAAANDPVPEHDSLVRMIHYWESGRRQVTERYELMYAAALGIEPDRLSRGPAYGVGQTTHRASSVVGFGLSDASNAADQDVDLRRKLRVGAAVDADVVAIFQAETQNLRLLDRRLGAPNVIGKTRAHVAQLEASLRYGLRAEIRGRVASVLGQSLTLAGWQLVDLGAVRSAWGHYERAKAAAREAGDQALLAHATGEQAYVLADVNATGDALDLVRQAYASYHRVVPGRLRSWLKAAEAEIAAMCGDERASRAALDDAAKNLPASDDGDELVYVVLDKVHFARWRGNCLTYFGDAATIGELAGVLREIDGSFTRASAGVHCDLARAMFAHGEAGEACAHLNEARRLATLTGSARQQRRIDQLTAKVAAQP